MYNFNESNVSELVSVDTQMMLGTQSIDVEHAPEFSTGARENLRDTLMNVTIPVCVSGVTRSICENLGIFDIDFQELAIKASLGIYVGLVSDLVVATAFNVKNVKVLSAIPVVITTASIILPDGYSDFGFFAASGILGIWTTYGIVSLIEKLIKKRE